MKIMITCPPMLGMADSFRPIFENAGIECVTPNVVQTLSVEELKDLVPQHDGWIIGDDPATREVFEAGKRGALKAAVKWGVGVDNVDFDACRDLGIPIKNTPNVFGREVADIAMGYVIALARETFQIDAGIRQGQWPKPCGISLAEKTVALVGLGDIGRQTAKRLMACDMKVIGYDPYVNQDLIPEEIQVAQWPNRLEEADFIVLNCALSADSRHMVNQSALSKAKPGVRIINVGRGPLIDEKALIEALQSGKVYSAALDVFEEEPLSSASALRSYPRCVLGSHNASNTIDAVEHTSRLAIETIFNFLQVKAA